MRQNIHRLRHHLIPRIRFQLKETPKETEKKKTNHRRSEKNVYLQISYMFTISRHFIHERFGSFADGKLNGELFMNYMYMMLNAGWFLTNWELK